MKRATEALVTEAQKVRGWSSYTQEESTVTVDERMVGSMAQVRHTLFIIIIIIIIIIVIQHL